MDHAITIRDLVHWSLFAVFVASMLGVVLLWLGRLGDAMSDLPPDDEMSPLMFWGAHAVPILLAVGWLLS